MEICRYILKRADKGCDNFNSNRYRAILNYLMHNIGDMPIHIETSRQRYATISIVIGIMSWGEDTGWVFDFRIRKLFFLHTV